MSKRNKYGHIVVARGETQYIYKCNSCGGVTTKDRRLTDFEEAVVTKHNQPNCKFRQSRKPFTITMNSKDQRGNTAMRRLG